MTDERQTGGAAPWLALTKFASLAWAAAVGWRVTWRRLDEMEKEARKLSWVARAGWWMSKR